MYANNRRDGHGDIGRQVQLLRNNGQPDYSQAQSSQSLKEDQQQAWTTEM